MKNKGNPAPETTDPARVISLVNPSDLRAQFGIIVSYIATGEAQVAATLVRSLCARQGLDARVACFWSHTADSLESGDWGWFAEAYAAGDYIMEDGSFLLVGDYTIRRDGRAITKLSAISGCVLKVCPIPCPKPALREIFGQVRSELPHVLPVAVEHAAGNLALETGEAFIVPDGWPDNRPGRGFAINNFTEQLKRRGRVRDFTDAIWHPDSRDLILSFRSTDGEAIQLLWEEYELHDSAGHGSGLGLAFKLHHRLLKSNAAKAVEEFRSDGVAGEVAIRQLPRKRAAAIVSSNLETRWSLDAQRNGGVNRDVDAIAASLTFHYAFDGGGVFAKDGKLALKDVSIDGLLRAFEPVRAAAIALTRAELDTEDPMAIEQLYFPGRSHERLDCFERYILQPCKHVTREWR